MISSSNPSGPRLGLHPCIPACFCFPLASSKGSHERGWRLISHESLCLCNNLHHSHICSQCATEVVGMQLHTWPFLHHTSYDDSDGLYTVCMLVFEEYLRCSLYYRKMFGFPHLAINRLKRHPASSKQAFGFHLWQPGFILPFFSFRTFPMTNRRWSLTWMLLMVWWWRATCSRGPAMPLRPGTGNYKNPHKHVT